MDDKTFFERLESALSAIRHEHELSDKHDALIFWYLRYKFDLDESDLKDRIVRDAHAEGVDAVVLDARQRTFYFVQGKSSDAFDGVTKNLGESDVKKTLSGVGYLLNGDYKGNITPELENFVDEYHDFDRSGDYQTKVLFLVEKKPPISNKFIHDFVQRHSKVEVEIVDFSTLKTFYETEYLVFRASPPAKISFEISGNPHRKEQPLPSAVFSIKGRELAKTYEEHRETLFQQNVRDPMGLKGTINKLIYKTATSDSDGKYFWYFNNGINLVCRKLHLSTNGKIATLEEPQVINGAQTTHAVHQAYVDGKLDDSIEILVRVAEVTDRTFVEQVTLFSNAQNAIRLRDLSSNDEVQDRLYRVLLDSYGIFYQRKRGSFDMEFPTEEAKVVRFGSRYKEKILDNEKAGLAYLSTFLGMPVEAKKEKYKIFFKDGGYYWEIFNEKVVDLAERMLLVWSLGRFVEAKKRDYRKAYNREKVKDVPDEKVMNDFFVTQADYFQFNLLFGMLNKKYDLSTRKGLQAALTLVDAAADELSLVYEQSLEFIRIRYLQDRQKAGSYLNNFFKSQKNLIRIRDDAGLD